MVTDEQEKHIQEANQKVLNFVVQLIQAYSPMIVAGVLTSTGLGVYRSCLTDQEYNDMVDAVSASRAEIFNFTPEQDSRILH